MTEKQYKKITAPFLKNKNRIVALRLVNLIFTGIVYAAYPALMLYLLITKSVHFQRCLIVPGAMFLFVSGLRKVIDRPRPYEKLNIKPLIEKDKNGQSMPSRHIFSVFVIAMTFLYINPYLSLPFFFIGAVLALARVAGGVHYPSDVLVGAAIGILSGIIGYFVI